MTKTFGNVSNELSVNFQKIIPDFTEIFRFVLSGQVMVGEAKLKHLGVAVASLQSDLRSKVQHLQRDLCLEKKIMPMMGLEFATPQLHTKCSSH